MKQQEKFISDLKKGFKEVNSSKKSAFRSFLIEDNSSNLKAFSSVAMSRSKKAILKEKLFSVLEYQESKNVWSYFSKPVFASFLVIAFLFSSVFEIGNWQGTNIAKASEDIVVAAVSGNVKVERSGEVFNVYSGFKILEKDKLMTNSGFLEIKFQDDSVARLGANTEVSLARVDGFTGKSDATLNLKKGNVWFNSISKSSGASEYDLQMRDLLVQIEDDAVLNMEVSDSFAKVIVFDEAVEVNYKSKSGFKSSILRKGDLINVKKEEDALNITDSVLLAEDVSKKNVDWYLDNLRLDTLYKSKINEGKILQSKERATVTPDSLWYPLKELQRSARLALSIDPVKKAEVKLGIADEKLHEAKVLSVNGKNDLAKKNLEDYKQTVNEVLQVVEEKKKDANTDVSTQIQNEVKSLVKAHKDIVDGTEDQDIVNTVLETELDVAEVSGDSTQVKLEQLEEKIDNAEDLIEEVKINELVDSSDTDDQIEEEKAREVVEEALVELDEIISGSEIDEVDAVLAEEIKEKAEAIEKTEEIEIEPNSEDTAKDDLEGVSEVIELDEDVVILKLDDSFLEDAVQQNETGEISDGATQDEVNEETGDKVSGEEKTSEEVVEPASEVKVENQEGTLNDVSQSKDETE